MANNRMYIVNTITGTRIFIGKYYPGTGWYPFGDDVEQRISAGFDAAQSAHHGGVWGADGWKLELEQERSESEWDRLTKP